MFSENMGIEPTVRSLAVPVVAALPLATTDRGASFCSLYHPQDALATSPITRSKMKVAVKRLFLFYDFLPVSVAKKKLLEYFDALEAYAVNGNLELFSELIMQQKSCEYLFYILK